MRYYDELKSISTTYIELMKSVYSVDDKDVIVISHDADDIRLQRHKISVDFRHFIQVFNVDNDSALEIIKNVASDNENRKTEDSRLRRLNHLVVNVHFIENVVDDLSFLKFDWVNFSRFNADVWL